MDWKRVCLRPEAADESSGSDMRNILLIYDVGGNNMMHSTRLNLPAK